MSDNVIDKQKILDASGGMLKKQLYCAFTTPTNGLEPVMKVIKEHLDFQMSLEERGIMFGAGPFWDDAEQNWEGEGMFIIRAKSIEHAKEILAEDPMHASGARTFTVRPWLMNEGVITLKMRYSDGSCEMV